MWRWISVRLPYVFVSFAAVLFFLLIVMHYSSWLLDHRCTFYLLLLDERSVASSALPSFWV